MKETSKALIHRLLAQEASRREDDLYRANLQRRRREGDPAYAALDAEVVDRFVDLLLEVRFAQADMESFR